MSPRLPTLEELDLNPEELDDTDDADDADDAESCIITRYAESTDAGGAA